MSELQFHVGDFDGPLDLLLYLISKHKLNICDIEISALLTQYLDAIEQMQQSDLELESEFLEMAARLVYIKTVSLLPRHEEAAELKKELEGQLIEYQRAKEAAKNLAALYQPSAVFVRRPAPVRSDPVFRGTASPKKLREAYILAFGKAGRRLPPPAEAFNGIVNRRFVSVTSRIVWLLRRLYRDGRAEYQALFQSGERSELVATFLAVLELVKSGRVSISDDNRTVFLNKRREAGERR